MGNRALCSSRRRLVLCAPLVALTLALAFGPVFAAEHESAGDESAQARRPSRSLMPVAGLPRAAVAKSRPARDAERLPNRAALPVTACALARQVAAAQPEPPPRLPVSFARAVLVVAPKTSPPARAR